MGLIHPVIDNYRLYSITILTEELYACHANYDADHIPTVLSLCVLLSFMHVIVRHIIVVRQNQWN